MDKLAEAVAACASRPTDAADVIARLEARLRHETLRRQAAEAQRRAMGELLTSVSDELRAPLNSVLGVAGALSATSLSAEQGRMVDFIRSSATVVERVLSDALSLSSLDAGSTAIAAAAFDLRRTIENAAGLFHAQAAAQGLELRLRLTGCPDTPVVGDAVRVAEVVANLISNAVKFTTDGHIDVAVRHTVPGGDAPLDVMIEVTDTGVGFDPRTVARLLDRPGQTDPRGAGRGLAICKGLVEAMGGQIAAGSTPGYGSRFTVRLPLRRAPH